MDFDHQGRQARGERQGDCCDDTRSKRQAGFLEEPDHDSEGASKPQRQTEQTATEDTGRVEQLVEAARSGTKWLLLVSQVATRAVLLSRTRWGFDTHSVVSTPF